MTLAGLARRMMVSKQNMTGMIARLEQLGLADRAGDPNDPDDNQGAGGVITPPAVTPQLRGER